MQKKSRPGHVPVFTDRTTEISPTSAGETAEAWRDFWVSNRKQESCGAAH